MIHARLSHFAVCLLLLHVPAWGFGNSNSGSGGGSSRGGGNPASGGGSDSSSSASTSNDPPGETEEEKQDREKRLAELQKKQQELAKQKRELQTKEKAKEKAQKPKPDDDEDFKIIVPQRVRNEAVSWLAGGGVAPPSLLLRATMQTLRRRLQARGEPVPALSDAAVIARLAQTL